MASGKEIGCNYRPWMLVEKKSKRRLRDPSQNRAAFTVKNNEGSRFRTLMETYAKMGINLKPNEVRPTFDVIMARKLCWRIFKNM